MLAVGTARLFYRAGGCVAQVSAADAFRQASPPRGTWRASLWSLPLLLVAVTGFGKQPDVRFDTAASVAAYPMPMSSEVAVSAVAETSESAGAQSDWLIPASSRTGQDDRRQWLLTLELSTLVSSPTAPRIDQLLIEVDLLEEDLVVADYRPRTQTASPIVGPITVEQCDEKNQHVGFNAAGSFPPVNKADAGADWGTKKSELKKYQQVAPLEVVAAAGTTSRRRGAFFKLRATPLQVLEGDKQFQLVVSAPPQWRGGLIQVKVQAQSIRAGLPGFAAETVDRAADQFLVAVHRVEDEQVRMLARQFAGTLERLRDTARASSSDIKRRALPTVLHQVAAKLDLADPKIPADWMQRTLFDQVDAHGDPQLRRLPVDVRVAILDFQAARTAFLEKTTELDYKLVSTED